MPRFSILHVKVVCKYHRFAIVFVSFPRILLVTVAQTLLLLLALLKWTYIISPSDDIMSHAK